MSSFTQIVGKHEGKLIFTSSQDTITSFLAGPILNYEGVCLALVMMWFAQDTAKKSPLKGIKNKTRALHLQNEMEAKWAGFDTVEKKGTKVIGKSFWWKSDRKVSLETPPGQYVKTSPGEGRESMHIFAIYFNGGPGHAIGIWRFARSFAIYDPNQGACAIWHRNFDDFIAEFLKNIYPGAKYYALCGWYYKPPPQG